MKAALASWLADPSPILVKELQATFRRPLFVRFLYLTTGFIALVVLGIGATIAAGGTPPAEVGRTVFGLFFLISATTVVFVAPGFGATLISGERQGGTWESLLLSNIDPWRIVRGKLLSGVASLGLVLVAIAPIAGITFLFGGVTPTEVLMGFVGVAGQLVFALAYGLAVGAHMPSMRVAIAVSTVTYGPIALAQLMLVAVVGAMAGDVWPGVNRGPLFWTALLTEHGDEALAWLFVVGIPAYVIFISVWFFLASAVAGVRSRSQDRSTPLKQWALVMSGATVALGGVVIALIEGAPEQRTTMTLGGVAVAMLLVFYAFVFVNDSDLPPRRYERRLATGPRWRRVLAWVGPGAAPTLRFGYVLVIGTALAAAAVFYVNGHYARAYSDGSQYDVAMLVFLGAGVFTAMFLQSVGARVGLSIPRGLAVRAVQLLVLFVGLLVPYLVAVVVDPGMSHRSGGDPSPALALSLVFPVYVAKAVTDLHGAGTLVVMWVLGHSPYGVAMLALTAIVEMEGRKRAKKRALQRASLDASVARASIPPGSRSTPPPPGPAAGLDPSAASAPPTASASPPDTAAAPGSASASEEE